MEALQTQAEGVLETLYQRIYATVYQKSSASKVDKNLWQDCWELPLNANSFEEQLWLQDRILTDIDKQIKASVERLQKVPTLETELLETYTELWKNFKVFMFAYYKLFQAFSAHVNREKDNYGILQLGFEKFKETVIVPNLPRIAKTILHHINQERQNKQGFTLEFRLIIESFIESGYGDDILMTQGKDNEVYYFPKGHQQPNYYEDPKYMSFYQSEFEKAMLKEIEDIYSAKTIEWLNHTVPEYCKIALNYFEDEVKICEQYYAKSLDFIKKNLTRIMIYDKYVILCDNHTSGIQKLLEKENIEGLEAVYKLFKLTKHDQLKLPEPLIRVSDILGKYIQESSQKYTYSQELKDKFLEVTNGLIAVRKYIMKVIKDAFEFNAIIDGKARKEFDNTLNSRNNIPDLACVFAQYFDNMMTEDARSNTPEAEVDLKMDEYLDVISGLGEKDRFINWYRHFLAVRLLEKPSIDFENKFISKMSQKWGQVNFHMLKTMISDISSSAEAAQGLAESKVIPKEKMDFTIKILTQSSWPPNLFIEGDAKKFHSDIKYVVEKFTGYYTGRNAGKKVVWVLNKGEVELKRTFNSNKMYRFMVTTLQANMILQFNDRTNQTFGELKTSLGVDQANFRTVWEELKILVKLKLISSKEPLEDERKIPQDADLFVLNEDFTNPKAMVGCIRSVAGKKKEETVTKVDQDTLKEREFALDAAIVRVMKSRRELIYNDLQEEVKKIITLFTPDPKIVKKRIESLIEREYLGRDEDNPNRFIYKP
jgi:hypothetical protein